MKLQDKSVNFVSETYSGQKWKYNFYAVYFINTKPFPRLDCLHP